MKEGFLAIMFILLFVFVSGCATENSNSGGYGKPSSGHSGGCH